MGLRPTKGHEPHPLPSVILSPAAPIAPRSRSWGV